MWPWGHLAFAYMFYSSFFRMIYRRRPTWPGLVLVVLGSQSPDLIDKPLGWTLNLLPGGRTLGHSLLFGTAIVIGMVLLLRRHEFPAWPFALGYYSHLVGDAIRPVLNGQFQDLAFLAWPLVKVDSGRDPTGGIVQHLLDAQLEGAVAFELGLAGIVFVWWLLDGAPGVEPLWRVIYRRATNTGK